MSGERAERNLIARAKLVATVLSEYGIHISTPDDGDLDDLERERWNACIEVVRRLRETPDVP